MNANKFLILVRLAEDQAKPQQKSLTVSDDSWVIEWSTSPSISMTVDFFNLTVGRALPGDGKKKLEEVWRVTHIPGHDRKIRYGENVATTTSTQAKPIENGVYIVKITGITSIAEGLRVEAGVGVAVFTIGIAENGSKAVDDGSGGQESESTVPAKIVNDTLRSLLDLADSSSD